MDGKLDHRDVRVRKGVNQDRPGAVIDSPAVLIEADVLRLDDFRDLLREFGAAWRWIVDLEEPLREAVEVVDGTRLCHRRHSGDVDVPVSRDGEDSAWLRNRLPKPAPGRGVA